MIRTLVHRADIAVTNTQEREKEVKHIRTALGRCGYRKWAFDLAKGKKTQSKHPSKNQGVITKNRTFVTLPFVDGLSQKLQRIYRTYGIATSFKPHSTWRKQLVSPKDPTPADKKSGVVYEIHCTNCPDIYIGHTGRQLGERLKEHKSLDPSRKLSAVAEHFSTTGHIIDWENTKVLSHV